MLKRGLYGLLVVVAEGENAVKGVVGGRFEKEITHTQILPFQ